MINKWTLALASAGLISPAVLQAEEQHQVLTALSQTTLSGYVDTSAIWSPGSPNGIIWGRTFDGTPDKLDGFNLHAVKLVLEKPLDEGQWSAGYKADLVFGPDANYYSTVGNGGVPDGSSDFNVKQAYVALRAPIGNGLDIKLGVFDTLIGYEVFESVNNPNFSRSYGYFIEPTHHTGVLLSYHINDMISVSGGVANGWTGGINDKIHNGTTDDAESRKAFLGSVTITLPEATGVLAGSSIYAGIVYGDSTAGVTGSPAGTGSGIDGKETTSTYVGATINTGLTGLSFGGAFDYRENGPRAYAVNGDNFAWTAALYASYQATEKIKLNARGEYAKGSVGTWYPGVDGNGNPNGANNNELGAITFTVDYSLWANVVTRGEVRWDHNMGGDQIYHGSDLDNDALTLTANFIYKF
jgi:hypothetical protein